MGCGREERLVYFVTKSCGKQNLVKLLKKGLELLLFIYLFICSVWVVL